MPVVRRLLGLASALATVTFVVPSVATAAPHPLEDFAAMPTLRGVTMSPSGAKIAAEVKVDGKSGLMILPVDGGQPVRIPLNTADDGDVLGFSWVNDDWLVLTLGGTTPWKYGGEVYITRVMSVRADGQQANSLLHKFRDLGQHVGVVWKANDGTPRVLVSAQRSYERDNPAFYPEVYEVDVSTDNAKLVKRGYEGVFDWVADDKGVVRMGYGYSWDGRQRRVLYRGDSDSDLREIETGALKGDRMITPELFLPGNKAITYTRDDNGFYGAYEFDPATMTLGKKVYGSAGYDVSGVILDKDRSRIVGLGKLEKNSTVDWVDPKMKALQDAISAKTGGNAAITNFNRAMDRAIFFYGSASQPGAVYLFDKKTNSAKLIGFENSKLKMESMHSVQAIRYKARDGLDIEAILTLPDGNLKNRALIVMPHGGPFARDTVDYNWDAQFLADRGYVVVQPNYRGSSGYGQKFADAALGEWGGKMQDDLIDAINKLAADGLIDPKRACIVGGSYGGYAAMRAAQRDAAHYRCAVSYAGVSDLDKFAKSDRGTLFAGTRKDWLKDQAPSFQLVSPLRTPQASAIPLLLMHGKKDQTVDVDHSRDMAKALKAAGRNVIYIEQPKADHHFSREEDRVEYLRALDAFLKQHNPA